MELGLVSAGQLLEIADEQEIFVKAVDFVLGQTSLPQMQDYQGNWLTVAPMLLLLISDRAVGFGLVHV